MTNYLMFLSFISYILLYLFILLKKAPLTSLQLVALVVVHEISHQWFGDTITNPWVCIFVYQPSSFVHFCAVE
jgi:Gpi18-like mannosyltransferase